MEGSVALIVKNGGRCSERRSEDCLGTYVKMSMLKPWNTNESATLKLILRDPIISGPHTEREDRLFRTIRETIE